VVWEASVGAVRTLVLLALVVTVTLAACGPRSPASQPDDGARSTPSGVAAPDDCRVDAGLDEVPGLHPSVDSYPAITVVLASPDGGCRIPLAVRLADSSARRAHGLMEVPELPAGTGMLFTYPDADGERTGGYYMKNTLVALDIAYLAADGTVVDIRAMQPCVEDDLAAGQGCPTYPPDMPYHAALEVPQGWFETVGVTEGWVVTVQR